MNGKSTIAPELLTPQEVAETLRVTVYTVSRWDKDGKFPEGTVFRTPGNHRRYLASFVRELLEATS